MGSKSHQEVAASYKAVIKCGFYNGCINPEGYDVLKELFNEHYPVNPLLIYLRFCSYWFNMSIFSFTALFVSSSGHFSSIVMQEESTGFCRGKLVKVL